ncbi:MAG TPA: TAT-variant-translocated molybdopterin oxidoreductase [Terriglobales bacterium]|nr:TAT-variant-translocated molybdopterin oxidoreductase [Terriglobales bacterium]
MELVNIKNGSDRVQEKGLRLEDVQAKLARARGPEYWRSLEELAETKAFRDMLHREFPRQAGEWIGDDVSRRNFLQLMSASLALAGLTSCTKIPTQVIVPYVRQPEEIILGKSMFYATAMPLSGYGQPVLVRSHEGRPTKIEGNPEHPASRGATDIFAQASILDLYDPDRTQTNLYRGEVRTWASFVGAVQGPLAAQKAINGAGLRLLTQATSSPTLASQIKGLQQKFPSMKWHQWEPLNRDAARAGAQMAFGEPVESRYQLAKADVIVSLDADFLYAGFPGFLNYAADWASRRDPDGQEGMNRLYVIESTPSTTGFKADHRLAVKPSEVEQYARALATRLGISAGGNVRPEHSKWMDAVVKDLQAHHGKAVVIAGETQSAAVHALAHAINDSLGAVGNTVEYTDPVIANPVDQTASLKELLGDISGGKVDMLLILGGNPVYDAPADFDFPALLARVPLKIHYGLYANETAVACDWHLNAAHYLESWSDTRAYNGMVSIIQPLIAPLYAGHTAHEVLALMNGQADASGYDLLRDYWKSQNKGGDFESNWRHWLHDGFIADSEFRPKNVGVKARDFGASQTQSKAGTEIVIRRDPSIYDGRFANNGWLQELPKPLTKLTWDNPALISPNTARQLGVQASQDADIVEVEYRGRKLRVPVWVQAGQPDDTVTLFLGYGRSRAGRITTGRGFNAYSLRFSDEPLFGVGAKLTRIGETYRLASTQGYQNIEGRNTVRSATIATYKQNPDFAHAHTEAPTENMYPEYPHPMQSANGAEAYVWGMSIDLGACVGCNACIIACQAENNIPVVGKQQVIMGRHMHWIRVDGYYQGDPSSPRMYYEPVPCQQCENAPCELVCPVGATVHSTEGLNDMVYNRCVGTRYCSNNCPYKVRRFNFLLFQDWDTPQLKLVRNPEVSVRSRGVMEKCTYCVQRITHSRIHAEEENRRIRDGEIQTACQEVCPASAIQFGDINDSNTLISGLKKGPRNYGLLEEINTRPRTSYLAAVINPNPEIPVSQPEQNF